MKQARLTDRPVASTSDSGSGKVFQKRPETSTFRIDVEGINFKNDALWPFLVETVKRNPLYAGLIGYTREKVLPSEPNITVRELASKLSISPGEAMVLLSESQSEK